MLKCAMRVLYLRSACTSESVLIPICSSINLACNRKPPPPPPPPTATPMEMEMHKKHVQCTRAYQRMRARARWKNAKICKTTKNQKKIKLKPQGEPERKNTLLLGGGERKKKKRTLLTDLLLSSLHINRNVQPCWDRLSRLHRLPFLRGNKRRGRRSGFLPTFAGTTL